MLYGLGLMQILLAVLWYQTSDKFQGITAKTAAGSVLFISELITKKETMCLVL